MNYLKKCKTRVSYQLTSDYLYSTTKKLQGEIKEGLSLVNMYIKNNELDKAHRLHKKCIRKYRKCARLIIKHKKRTDMEEVYLKFTNPLKNDDGMKCRLGASLRIVLPNTKGLLREVRKEE